MNKYIITLMIVFALPIVSLAAENKIEFDLKIGHIISFLNKTIVYYGPEFKIDSDDFSYWKIRVRCEDGVEAYLEGNNTDVCNLKTSVSKHTIDNVGGYVIFANKNDSPARAEVKFRAFDLNDNWIGSESTFISLLPEK